MFVCLSVPPTTRTLTHSLALRADIDKDKKENATKDTEMFVCMCFVRA